MDPFTLLNSKARLAVSVGTTSPVPCVSDGACRSQQAVSHAWVPVLLSVLGHPARTQFPDAGSSVILEVSVKMLLEEMDIYVRTFERPGVPSTAQGGLLSGSASPGLEQMLASYLEPNLPACFYK